jgi:Kef-type K+ transport system membrane component KefB
MDNIWFQSALWIGLALLASLCSIRLAISVALTEIIIGAIGGNIFGLPLTPWVNYLAGFGAILLTFLAGTEIDPRVVRRHFWSSMSIGITGFFAPYLGVMLFARYALAWPWPWPQAQIAGISLSHNVGRRRLRGNGRNRLEQDRVGKNHPRSMLYQ